MINGYLAFKIKNGAVVYSQPIRVLLREYPMIESDLNRPFPLDAIQEIKAAANPTTSYEKYRLFVAFLRFHQKRYHISKRIRRKIFREFLK
jgi:hypothetical protein